jgi:hypothetical protein
MVGQSAEAAPVKALAAMRSISSRYRHGMGAAFSAGCQTRRPLMNGNIFNSKGTRVAVVVGPEIFDLSGKKLFDLKGKNIYRLSGELVGHLNDASGSAKRLDKATDRLFS